MSIQIAVRLPDDLVEYVDSLVVGGEAPSRAAVISSALEREMRARLAERDIEILKNLGSDLELDALAAHATSKFEGSD